jgi:hypothetical protein
MTTITSLTGTIGAPTQPPAEAFTGKKATKSTLTPQNVQSWKGGWRKILHYKDRLEFVSANGGAVTIPIASLWATAEAADAKLKLPA